ncbi:MULTISPECIES: CPBP family intramembrane glutamic endopeptidase [unclassified Modestobacter]|uniref:CPBP family intramembrane glutamic endopeptidase n=1 Tax=unclassified Modestobacter TaxID=2643866 RepID=UPI0022AA8033|nr:MULTISPECIES: type II CAAX endopeptidase family protein [unclassified Modestobacter]MCZ2824044.1 type II CAAX endopeptidase family protein [Modestobacter sp. VKM Ac-2981]MCZ2852289.1 type II CAAX endopeptidase family protein [Modestobacter sp. VKM Ac-2982]
MTGGGWGAGGQAEPPYTGPPPTGRYGAPPRVPLGPPPGGPAGWPAAPGWTPPGVPPYPPPAQHPYPPPAQHPHPPPAQPPSGPPRPAAPPGAPPHDVPQPYFLLMRTRDWAWWRPVLGLLLFTVLYGVAAVVLVLVVLLTGVVPDLAMQDLTDIRVLLVTNASLIVAIPIVWVCWLVPHGLRIGWSSSVLGRLRWQMLLPWTWRALATLGLAVAIGLLLTVAATDLSITGPTSSFGWLLLVVLLTTPLQCAAEEYFFRGYLSQAIAGWVGRPQTGAVVAGVLTAALFSAAHAPPDVESFLYRFVIGLVLSAAVWLTGGLEAAIALHAVNNVVIFIMAGALGEELATADPGGALSLATTLLGMTGMVAFVVWVAVASRRLRPELLSPALQLTASPSAGPAQPRWGGPPAPPPWAGSSAPPPSAGSAPSPWGDPPAPRPWAAGPPTGGWGRPKGD